MDQIRLMTSEVELDVFTISETWLKGHLHSDLVNLQGYKMFRLDRGTNNYSKKRGEGLITYINEKHGSSCESLDDLNLTLFIDPIVKMLTVTFTGPLLGILRGL